jgi:hypothetical protein
MSLLGATSLVSWKQSRFGPGLELLETYTSEVENECVVLINAFDISDDGFEQSVGVDEQSGETMHEWVQVHRGLRSDSWSLSELFRIYFPTLKRGAALAMLCSFVEHELNKLCEDIQKYLEVGIALSDIHGTGIERASRYLRVVGNLPIASDHMAWTQRADVFKIRNAMIHAGGRTDKADVIRIIESSKFLSMQEGEISILDGYLAHCISVFNVIGDLVGEALKQRFREDIRTKRASALRGHLT